MANSALRYGGQAILYILFAAFIGYFSTAPAYQHLPADQALLRLSFRAPGQLTTDCRPRSPEELAKMSPQLRAQMDCPRERSPVRVRVDLDGKLVLDETFPAAGLRRDGAASGYRRQPIPAGEHLVRVQVNDNVRVKGFNHEKERQVTLAPGQVILIDFIPDQGGVVIR
ncbi:MAG: hypothetical protein IT522_05790 [Burkholderiales bacterium]|nr:hypothetical protein [Burkholderiales bacterium]